MTLTVAFCIFALSALQGVTLCLCNMVQHDADHHECCHDGESGDLVLRHDCDHLSFDSLQPGEKMTYDLTEFTSGTTVFFTSQLQFCESAPMVNTGGYHPPGVLATQLLFVALSTQLRC